MKGITAVALSLAAASPSPAAEGPAVAAEGPAVEAAQGYVFLPFRGGVGFAVAVDTSIVAAVNEHEARIVDMRGNLVTMIDSYLSKPGADGGCKDGREVYVRLLDFATKTERSATLAASCRHGIVAADPPVTWKADGSGYTVNRSGGSSVWVAAPAAD